MIIGDDPGYSITQSYDFNQLHIKYIPLNSFLPEVPTIYTPILPPPIQTQA